VKFKLNVPGILLYHNKYSAPGTGTAGPLSSKCDKGTLPANITVVPALPGTSLPYISRRPFVGPLHQ